jgi:methionyl-tRNA formyltransferase
MSVALYLINKKGYDVLKTICLNQNYSKLIDCVISAEDKGNAEDFYEEIKEFCIQKKIPFYNKKIGIPNVSKYSIAIGWRWLIKDISNLIVIHDSYLPKYRGFAPVVNMLINGEDHLAATAIWASDKMDGGDIITQQKVNIDYPIKILEAIEIVSALYVKIVSEIFDKLVEIKELKGKIQDHEAATYSIWRDEEDYFINWKDDARNIVRFVNAVGYPYDGAKTRIYKGDIIRIKECSIVKNIKAEIPAPGKVLMMTETPIILCGKNAISLDKIEDLDGNPFSFKKFRTRLV